MPYPVAAARGHTHPQGVADWWEVAGQTVVAAYQPIGADDLADSYINLANPGTYDAAPGVAPTWVSGTGWTFDGTQYLNTLIVQGPYSTIVRFSDFTGSGFNVLFGYWNVFDYRYVANVSRFVNDSFFDVATLPTSGVAAVTGDAGYFDGVSKGALDGELTTSTRLMPIAARVNHLSGGIGQYSPVKIQALAIYSTTLSADDVAALTTRMQALTG